MTRTLVPLPALLISALLFSMPAWAMRTQVSISIVAWSEDGASVLLREDGNGPEGGGYERYRLIEPQLGLTITPSSDMSPGDGSTPQSVDEKECRTQLESLQEKLTKLKFPGVRINVANCAKRGDFELKANVPVGYPLVESEQSTSDFGEQPPGQEMLRQNLPAGTELGCLEAVGGLSATLSPTSRLLVLIGGDMEHQQLLAVLGRDRDKGPWRMFSLQGQAR